MIAMFGSGWSLKGLNLLYHVAVSKGRANIKKFYQNLKKIGKIKKNPSVTILMPLKTSTLSDMVPGTLNDI